MMNFRLKFFLLAAFLLTANSVVFPRVTFAAYDVECVAKGIADYMDGVLTNAPSSKYKNIRFTTPAFNMTEPQFEDLVAEFAAQSSSFDRSDLVVTGNAYNVDGASVLDWMARVRSTEIGSKPVILTETGWYPHGPDNGFTNERGTELGNVLRDARSTQGPLLGALIFNGFGNNSQSDFSGQVMSNEQFTVVCNNTACGFIGVNSATGLFGNDDNNRASGLGMKMTLGIINNDPGGVANGANNALSKGLTPVLRIGVGNSSGGFDNPSDLVTFLDALDPQLTGQVYIIVGPNEPNAEGWADPGGPDSCDREMPDDMITGTVVKIRGILQSIVGTNDLPNGQTAQTTNQSVENAVIAIFEGDPNSPTGKIKGDLVNPPEAAASGVKHKVRTEKDGYFEVEMRKGSGRNKINYLTVFCQNTGNATSDIATIYALDSTKPIDGLMLYENCPKKATTPEPPEQLPYISQLDFLSCDIPSVGDELYNLYKGFNQVARGIKTFINLNGLTDEYWTNRDLDEVPNPNDGNQTVEELTHARPSGRIGLNTNAYDVTAIYGSLVCLTVGCLDGDTIATRGTTPPIPSCDVYREGNKVLNARNSYGFAQNLASPSFGVGSDDVQRYIAYRLDGTLENKIVCNFDGHDFTLREFALPTQWAEDEIADALGGLYICHKGEQFCLPEDFFPWNKLINFYNRGLDSSTTTQTDNDSVASATRENEFHINSKAATLDCQLSGQDCSTPPKAFSELDAVIVPDGNLTSPIAAANAVTRGAKTPNIASPLEMLYDPKTNEEEEELAQGKIRKKFSTVSTGGRGITRLGKPKSLCICPWPLRILGQCGTASSDQLMNYFDQSLIGALPSAFGTTLTNYLYGTGYSYITENNSSDRGLGYYFSYEITGLEQVFQEIYNNFVAPWFDGNNRLPYTKGGECQGAWVAATEEELAICAPNYPDDPSCTSQNGCGNCKCVNFNNSECFQWQTFRDNYTCTPTVQIPPIDPDVSTTFPVRNLTTAAGNFLAALRGPIDPNPKISDGGGLTTEATGVTSQDQAKGTDFKIGESVVYFWDQLSQSVSDPNFSNRVFTWRKVIRKRGTAVAMPPVDDYLCQFGTNESHRSIPDLPDNLIEVLEVAGDAFHVPAPLLLAFMYSEGSFNPNAANPYNGAWTDTDVDTWINEDMEAVGCDPNDDYPKNPFNFDKPNWSKHGNAVRVDFPNRVPNICNFLDLAYASASLVSEMSYATGGDPVCFGQDVSTGLGRPASCGEWRAKRLVLAAKDYTKNGDCYDFIESGFYGSGHLTGDRQTFSQCFPNTMACSTILKQNPLVPDASYIFNVLEVYWYYTLPEMRTIAITSSKATTPPNNNNDANKNP